MGSPGPKLLIIYWVTKKGGGSSNQNSDGAFESVLSHSTVDSLSSWQSRQVFRKVIRAATEE